MNRKLHAIRLGMASLCFSLLVVTAVTAADVRLRVVIETDAGGDPDDEQSLVRLLLYTNEFDIEGLIANRPVARDGENMSSVRDGLGIVRSMVAAYGECHENLVRHDRRYPSPEQLLARTVAGYDDVDDGVKIIVRAVDAPDPRPVWFCNWGTDDGSAESCLKRALDRVLDERGPDGYRQFKSRLRLSSADKFGTHTTTLAPPFPIWVNTLQPALEGRRWYHRFSPLTATAGGFDVERDVRTGHGPLGAMYPLNTSPPQKEGDTMMFLYLLPMGLSNPLEPTWGSWGGRYGRNDEYAGQPYYWANQADTWQGTTHRDNTLARWAVAFQNDFRARLDWCVADSFDKANHPPFAVLNGDTTQGILELVTKPGTTVPLTAIGSHDPDGDPLSTTWFVYREAGTWQGDVTLSTNSGLTTEFVAPQLDANPAQPTTIHIILQVHDSGTPTLHAYRRMVVTVRP